MQPRRKRASNENQYYQGVIETLSLLLVALRTPLCEGGRTSSFGFGARGLENVLVPPDKYLIPFGRLQGTSKCALIVYSGGITLLNIPPPAPGPLNLAAFVMIIHWIDGGITNIRTHTFKPRVILSTMVPSSLYKLQSILHPSTTPHTLHLTDRNPPSTPQPHPHPGYHSAIPTH